MDISIYQELRPVSLLVLTSTLIGTILFIYFLCGWNKSSNKGTSATIRFKSHILLQ